MLPEEIGEGLALANQGDVNPQSLAGAMATGTHGTGLDLGNLATFARGFRLVGADGDARWCDASTNADLFEAQRLSLGLFGIATEIECDVVPAYYLAERVQKMRWEEARERFDTVTGEHRHVEFWFFPHADHVILKTLSLIETIQGLDSGTDVIILTEAYNTVFASWLETLFGGTGTDVVTLGSAGNTMLAVGFETLIGGAGTDVIALQGSAGNTVTISNLEAVIGGSSIDVLLLGSAGGTLSVSSIETVVGSAAIDALTLRQPPRQPGGDEEAGVAERVPRLAPQPGRDALAVKIDRPRPVHYALSVATGNVRSALAGVNPLNSRRLRADGLFHRRGGALKNGPDLGQA